MSSQKIIAVIGATGNQGGSVARRFLKDENWHVRALTRNPSSPAAQELASLGAELVKTEIDDVSSLTSALAGANLIFSVTQYWEPFFRPDCRAAAAAQGISCRQYAYNVELRQGKNIADAAYATISTLDNNGFIVSTLSHAGKSSKGKFKELYHFDSKAEVFPDYVNEKYPELAKKMSCVHTGYFMTSWRILPGSYFKKLDDGSFQMRFPTREDRPVPHLDVNSDTGNFIYAVSQMPPGHAYMAEGSTVGFGEYLRLFTETTGAKTSYKQVGFEEMVEDTEDRDTGIEVAWMYMYADEPGYDGGMELLRAKDLRERGIECPMTSLEEWVKRQDWSAVLNK